MDKLAIQEFINDPTKLYSLSAKVNNKVELTNEETDITKEISAWANEIGKRGKDIDGSFASYIQSVITPELDASRDFLIDALFNEGQIGEFDYKDYTKEPENTLKAYNSAKGGNVFKSYLDLSKAKSNIKHSQVEFEIPYVEFRKPDSFKTVAKYTMYAEEALKDKLFSDVFNTLDKSLTNGIVAGGSTLTLANMDALVLYLLDRQESGDEGTIVTQNKYAQAIARLEGYDKYMSDSMKEKFNKYGMAVDYSGFKVAGVSGYRKVADGSLIIPDKTIYAFMGKVGNIDMRGDIRVYETSDNQNEVLSVKVTGFDYQFAITKPNKVQKLTLS